MRTTKDILIEFYTAFSNGDATTMCKNYDVNIQFRDPAFGLLKGNEVCEMWKMLTEKSKGNMKIEFSVIKADQYTGSVRWIATYKFGKNQRTVVNTVLSEFQFKEGLIIKQTDQFDIWKWSKQAFGITGYLLGWTGFFQKKVEKQAVASLKKYSESH